MSRLLLMAALLMGCGKKEVLCPTIDDVLYGEGEDAITCEEAWQGERYIEALAARPLNTLEEQRVVEELHRQARKDAAGTKARLARARALVDGLKSGSPWRAQAKVRADALYDAFETGGLWPKDQFERYYGILKRAIAVWKVHEPSKLAIGEMDIEAWIRYASLCREVQGGGVLNVSIGDRVGVYRTITDRFESATRDDQVAMLGLASFWQGATENWQFAGYDAQQEWIKAAPLPQAMEGTSVDYIQAIMGGDVARHVEVLHDKLGPLRFNPPL